MSHYRDGYQDDSRSKRQQILAAAYEVFSRKGYHRATVDEIIALADTGKGTVYNYFTNKEQLFYTLVRERNQPFEVSLAQLAESEQPPLKKIEVTVRLALQFYQDNADLWRVLMHEIRGFGNNNCSQFDPHTLAKYREGFQRTIGWLEKILSEGVAQGVLREIDVTKTAYALFSVIVMMVYQKYVSDDIDGAARQVTDIFLNGAIRR